MVAPLYLPSFFFWSRLDDVVELLARGAVAQESRGRGLQGGRSTPGHRALAQISLRLPSGSLSGALSGALHGGVLGKVVARRVLPCADHALAPVVAPAVLCFALSIASLRPRSHLVISSSCST